MPSNRIRETDLYPPVKKLLEKQGYEVKGEVGQVDVVACRNDEEPVIVELKTGFALSLFHQAIDRQKMTDAVYIAVPHGKGRAFNKSLKMNVQLCRRLGLGLLTVRVKSKRVEVHLDPQPYRPRKSQPRKARLLKEFTRRVGDPNSGGATRQRLVTAYRQDALRCLHVLNVNGPTKAAVVAKLAVVERARRIMADDYYGWFQRTGRGIYALTPQGEAALTSYASELQTLAAEETKAG